MAKPNLPSDYWQAKRKEKADEINRLAEEEEDEYYKELWDKGTWGCCNNDYFLECPRKELITELTEGCKICKLYPFHDSDYEV